jgi:hypothetical protein
MVQQTAQVSDFVPKQNQQSIFYRAKGGGVSVRVESPTHDLKVRSSIPHPFGKDARRFANFYRCSF